MYPEPWPSLILDSVARLPTAKEADVALDVVCAQLSEKIRVAADPEVAAILRLVFGRLLDATETGGTRR